MGKARISSEYSVSNSVSMALCNEAPFLLMLNLGNFSFCSERSTASCSISLDEGVAQRAVVCMPILMEIG